MRYIVIPKPELVFGTRVTPTGPESGMFPYHLTDWLRDEVWPLPVWHDDESGMLLYFRLRPLFEGVKPGDVVAIEDADYERFAPIATKRGEKLPQQVHDELMRLLQPIVMAPKVAPAKAAETEPATTAAAAAGGVSA